MPSQGGNIKFASGQLGVPEEAIFLLKASDLFLVSYRRRMDAIGRLDMGAGATHPWERKENPQTYELMPAYGENPRPSQHTLGLVGGNEVPYKNRLIQVETESDLRGITRANTFCPDRQHKPLPSNTTQISRDTPKQKVTVPVYTQPLKQSQFWAYPATLAPERFVIETCGRPEKY